MAFSSFRCLETIRLRLLSDIVGMRDPLCVRSMMRRSNLLCCKNVDYPERDNEASILNATGVLKSARGFAPVSRDVDRRVVVNLESNRAYLLNNDSLGCP